MLTNVWFLKIFTLKLIQEIRGLHMTLDSVSGWILCFKIIAIKVSQIFSNI